ncbi:MAG: hypothetical protein R6V19_12300 [Armatimonadota bacterium]
MRATALISIILTLAIGWPVFAEEEPATQPPQQDQVREITPSIYGLVGLKRVGFFVKDIDEAAAQRTGITKTMMSDYFSRILAETDTVAFANRGKGVAWFHVDVRLKPLQDVNKTAYCVDLKLVENAFVMSETRTILVPYAAIWQCPGYLQVADDDACADAVKTALRNAVDYFADLYARENAAEHTDSQTAPADTQTDDDAGQTQPDEPQE